MNKQDALAGVVGAKVAIALFNQFGVLDGIVAATDEQLQAVDGMNAKKCRELRAAFNLGKALFSKEISSKINRPQDLADILMPEMGILEHESFRVVLLNTRNDIIKIIELYKGMVHGAPVRVAEIYREAMRNNATSIIVVHNHPSGNPEPSADDIRITRDIEQVGKMVDISMIDHLIIARTGFISLKERGFV